MTSDRPTGTWLRERARAGAVGTLVLFGLVAVTAGSRAAHGVLSPAALAAVVAGAAAAAAITGWVTGLHEGAAAVLAGEVAAPGPADRDDLAGRRPWRLGAWWALGAGLWAGTGAVLVAAVLQHRSAPTPVVLVTLLVLAAPAAVAVDLAARAAGARVGALLRHHRPDAGSLLGRAWGAVALPVAASQLLVNAGAAWLLFQGAAAEGRLTRGEALGDALVLAALLAGLFGALAARWGSLDVAAGRIEVPVGLVGRGGPVGPQALVYAAALAVVAASIAGLVVPASPSLLRVALVRGLLAGGLAALAAALGYVRGACNAEPLALGARPPLPTADPARGTRALRVPTRRRLAGAAAAAAALLLVAPLLGPAPEVRAEGLDGFGVVAELDAFGVRVEYDLPVPAGTGSAPQVVGAIRRSSGGEAANGVAASPTRFDPVVGGTVADPDKEGKGDESNLPQAECAYPGALTDVRFAFPTDVRGDLAGVPPVGHAAARCGAGPTLELDAAAVASDTVAATGPGLSVGGGTAEAVAGPVDGVLGSSAAARADDVSILGGLIRVESVEAHGESATDGTAGGARTEAAVDVVGVTVAGTTFDLRGGDLVVAGTRLPVGSEAAAVLLDQVGAALAPVGCSLTVLDDPGSYPQGFLFARPDPELGVADDGSLAASMAGGLLVECDLPQDLTAPTGFNPQRIQVVLGFAFTSVAARADIGGFGLDDLAAGAAGGAGPGLEPTPVALGGDGLPAVPAAGSLPDGAAAVGPAADPGPPGGGALGEVRERIELLAANFAADRPWVWAAALGLWLLLTHRGVERLRLELAEVA